MNFVSGDLWTQLSQAAAASKKPADIAVAYMGANGDKLLPVRPKSRIVVDASLAAVQGGSTNPAPLLILLKQGIRIFRRPLLHAKTFVFDDECFVGSSNASNRSVGHLTEAAIRTSDAQVVASARKFVSDIATDELDAGELEWLQKHYRPPKNGSAMTPKESSPVLILELAKSFGYSGHQVQLPKGAWKNFFGISGVGESRELTFRNRDDDRVITRKVVSHAKVITVDIPNANSGSIWQVWQVGRDSYEYRVLEPTRPAYLAAQRELKTTFNPFQRHGRKWMIQGKPKT